MTNRSQSACVLTVAAACLVAYVFVVESADAQLIPISPTTGVVASSEISTCCSDRDPADRFDHALSNLYVQVLRPLCWTGLLHEQQSHGFRTEGRVFTKTPLWRAALRLATDRDVTRAVRH